MKKQLFVMTLLAGCTDKENSNTALQDPEPQSQLDPNNIDDDGDGWTEAQGDCDDTDPSIGPTASEIENDGIDQDCDGEDLVVDADGDGADRTVDCDDADPTLNLADLDQDGYTTCDDDCDDENPSLSPADIDLDGFSTCDGDCNDNDATAQPSDNDGDGLSSCDGDCDDSDASIHPSAEEIPNDTIDQNCDGQDLTCFDQSVTILPIENVTLDYIGNGIWQDSNVRAYNYPPNSDLSGWMLFDLSTIPQNREIKTVDIQMFQMGDAHNNPELVFWYSSFDNWTRENVLPGSIPRETIVSTSFNSFTGNTWHNYSLNTEMWDFSSDVSDGWLTIGLDNQSQAYSYVYFHGVDDPGTQPKLKVVYAVCDDLQWIDADGDGYDNTIDCDDGDPEKNHSDFDSDGASSCTGDCDDNDPLLNLKDADQDGLNTCDGDCDDTDSYLNQHDLDGDGNTSCDGDCDDFDVLKNDLDSDGDGFSSCDGDCDDTTATISPIDNDGDGFSTCTGD